MVFVMQLSNAFDSNSSPAPVTPVELDRKQRGTLAIGGIQPTLPGQRWWDIIQKLWNASAPSVEAEEQLPQGPTSDIIICNIVREAAAAAERDPEWQGSGVSAHLDSALQIAQEGDCRGAVAAALGLLDFVSLAQKSRPAPSPAATLSTSANTSAAQPARAVNRDDMPWAAQERDAPIHKSHSWDACTLASESLHVANDAALADGEHDVTTQPQQSGGQRSGSAAKDSTGGGLHDSSSSPRGGGGDGKPGGGDNMGGDEAQASRALRKSVSDPEEARPSKKRRPGTPTIVPRSLSDPCTMRRTRSAVLNPGKGDTPGGSSGGGTTAAAGRGSQPLTVAQQGSGSQQPLPTLQPGSGTASDEGFPGHNSIEDVHPDSKLLRQAKNAADGGGATTSYWAGKVKHRLGSSTVELFFLSALLPSETIEHMPPTLFVTDLVQRSSLQIGSEHSVIRCRLDFLTNRQLRKLRSLAELRLACVSSLQHCAITLVPYLDAQKSLHIIGFIKVDQA